MDLPTVEPGAAPLPAAADPTAPPWQWPLPPGREEAFAPAPSLRTPQPCRIEFIAYSCALIITGRDFIKHTALV